MEQNKSTVMSYFKYFQEGNLEELSKLYHDDVHLIDWNGEWKGKEEVLKMNKELFESDVWRYRVIVTDVEQPVFRDSRLYCKIQITIGNDTLKVLDVIDLNTKGEIIKIEAYNG